MNNFDPMLIPGNQDSTTPFSNISLNPSVHAPAIPSGPAFSGIGKPLSLWQSLYNGLNKTVGSVLEKSGPVQIASNIQQKGIIPGLVASINKFADDSTAPTPADIASGQYKNVAGTPVSLSKLQGAAMGSVGGELPDTADVKIAYHGSPIKDLDSLDAGNGNSGKGAYVTEDPKYAAKYASGELGGGSAKGAGKVYPLDLSALNILDGKSKTYSSIVDPIMQKFTSQFEKISNPDDSETDADYKDAFDDWMSNYDRQVTLKTSINKTAQKMGYDGVYYKDGIPEIVLNKSFKIK